MNFNVSVGSLVLLCCLEPLGLLFFKFLSIWNEGVHVGVSSKVEFLDLLFKANEASVYLARYRVKLEILLCY